MAGNITIVPAKDVRQVMHDLSDYFESEGFTPEIARVLIAEYYDVLNETLRGTPCSNPNCPIHHPKMDD